MRLGMNLFLWATHVTEEHFGLLEEIRTCGYEGVEIPTVKGDVEHYRSVRRVLDDLGLGVTTVTFVDADQDPLSPDPAVRRRGLDHIRWAVEVAQTLGARVVCGPLHSALGTFSGCGPTDAERERSVEFLREAGAIAAAAADDGDVVLALEYLNRFESYLVNTAADTDALVRAVDHPAIRLAYDTHHAHIEEADVAAAIRACAGSLAHVQLSESHRGTPGSGQVDWDATLRTLREVGYDGWLMVESFSRSDPEFAAAVHIWRDLAPSAIAVLRGAYEFLQPRL